MLVCLNTRFSWYMSKFEIRKVQSMENVPHNVLINIAGVTLLA